MRRKHNYLGRIIFSLFLLAGIFNDAYAQLVVTNQPNPTTLAQTLAGPGVTVSNATIVGGSNAYGTFSGTNCNLGISDGIVLTSGSIFNTPGPNNQPNASSIGGTSGDPDLNQVAGTSTHDKCILEFDVVPIADTLEFRYVFGSEEYLEYVNLINDVFGFFVSGPGISGPYSGGAVNIATIPGTSIPVSINTVNNIMNSTYYVNNGTGFSSPQNQSNFYIQYDGFTTVLIAKVVVVPCNTYHFKLAVADAVDFILDSGVFLEAGSLTSTGVSVSTNTINGGGFPNAIEGCLNGEVVFTRPSVGTTPLTVNYSIGGSAINGVDYAAIPTSVVIPAGLNNVSVPITPLVDGLPEGLESVKIYLHEPCGNQIYDSATLYIQDSLTLSMSADVAICSGMSTVLSAANALSYVWTPASSLTGANTANPIATPAQTTTYVATGTLSTCIAKDSVKVTVVPAIIADAGADTSVCKGNSVQLNATLVSGYSYSWAPAIGLSAYNIPNPVFQGNSTTNYTLTVTNSGGCTAQDQLKVTVNPLPVASAGPDKSFCAGDSTIINGLAGSNSVINWLPATGLSNTNSIQPYAAPSQTTAYTLSVTGANGCVQQDVVNVTVNPLPAVDAGPDQSICDGSSTLLSATGASIFKWTPSTGLSAPNVPNPQVNIQTDKTYYVTGTDANGCKAQDSVTISFFHLNFADAGNNAALCLGQPIQLDGSASNAVVYNWLPNTGMSCGGLCAKPNVTPNVTTTYTLTVINANGCKDQDSVTITVNPLPVVSIIQNDTALCAGDNMSLNAAGAQNYSWNPVTGLSNSGAASITAQPAVTTDYTVTGTSALGCISTDQIHITVNALPSVNAGPDKTICSGDTFQLSGLGSGQPIWTPSSSLDNPNSITPKAFPAQSTNYYLTITNSKGCQKTDSLKITVNALPVADAGADTAFCPGGFVQLQAMGGTTYKWTPATGLNNVNISNPTASGNTTTNYHVQVTDANGCSNKDSVVVLVRSLPQVDAGPDGAICPGDSTMLYASGAITYAWSGIGLSASNVATPMASPASTFQYSVVGTDIHGCSQSDTTEVTVYPAPVADAGPDAAICIGNNYQLNGSGGSFYIWAPGTVLSNPTLTNPVANPTATTVFTVMATDANGCKAVDSMTLTVNPLPNAAIITNDTVICTGKSVSLLASGGVNYSWSPSTFLNNGSIVNPVSTPGAPITYTVTVTDANGCQETANVSIGFHPAIDPMAAPDLGWICPDSSITLSAYNGVSYSWAPAGSLDNPSSAYPMATPSAPTVYTVTMTDSNGCVNTDVAAVDFFPLPNANAGSDVVIVFGETVALNATGGVSYLWSPSLFLTDASISNPFSKPDSSITYYVTVTSAEGCVAKDSMFIQVEDVTFAAVPTAFTPNGDGLNDELNIVQRDGFTLHTFMVFNRWGEMVFETNNIDQGWDGNFAGKRQPIGSYMVIVKGTGSLGEPFIFHQSITLIR